MASSEIKLKGLETFSFVSLKSTCSSFNEHNVFKRSSEHVEEGPFSTIVRQKWVASDEQSAFVVNKIAPARREFSKEPHDIIKELRLLSRLSHINVGGFCGLFFFLASSDSSVRCVLPQVIDILGQKYTTAQPQSLSFWIPY